VNGDRRDTGGPDKDACLPLFLLTSCSRFWQIEGSETVNVATIERERR